MTPPQLFDINAPSNVFDFTLFKLGKFIDECIKGNREEEALAFEEAIGMYVNERIAIQWHRGQPFAIVFEAADGETLRGMGGIDKTTWENLSQETLEDLGARIDESENPNDSE
tara:strand:- start:341 stop:679 length:339 start_codon:yes stop_codon:yes gene_type:complete